MNSRNTRNTHETFATTSRLTLAFSRLGFGSHPSAIGNRQSTISRRPGLLLAAIGLLWSLTMFASAG